MNRIFRVSLPLLIVLCGLVISSCQTDTGRSLEDFEDLTATDSLLYYYGELRAAEYNRDAIADTTLLREKQIQTYFDGVQAGFNMIRGGDELYDRGVHAGIKMAINSVNFEREYMTSLNRAMLLEGLRYGLFNPDSISELEIQEEFYKILNKLNKIRENKIRDEAIEALAAAAKSMDMKKISDSLYCKVITPGEGPLLTKGQTVGVDVDFTHPDGKSLGLPDPESVIIGSPSMPAIITKAYCSMNMGESATFATYANEIFGRRSNLMDLDPYDVVLINITVKY